MKMKTRLPSRAANRIEDLVITPHNPAMVRTVQDWRSMGNSFRNVNKLN